MISKHGLSLKVSWTQFYTVMVHSFTGSCFFICVYNMSLYSACFIVNIMNRSLFHKGMAESTPQILCVFSGPFREPLEWKTWINANVYLGSICIIKAMPLHHAFYSYMANNLFIYNLKHFLSTKHATKGRNQTNWVFKIFSTQI